MNIVSRFARLPSWVWYASALLLSLSGLSYCSYTAGRDAERSSMRDSLIAADVARADTIERLRKERGAIAAAAVAASAQRDSARKQLQREIAASRRTVTIVNETTVRVVDTTSNTSRDVDVPPEITERIAKDSARIDSLVSDNAQKTETIDKLRLQLSVDTTLLRQKDKIIADLRIEPPKPPLLDRVIARVAVPATKVAVVGGVAYGGWKLVEHFILKR